MNQHSIFKNAHELSAHFRKLRADRLIHKPSSNTTGNKRRSLTREQRELVLLKTQGRCHICGGEILGNEAWEADHVFAHAQGGTHSAGNFLPAHQLCNNYRWYYGSEEFQWILKLGVWMRTQVEKENVEAIKLAERFVKSEAVRESRKEKAGLILKL